jgi:predicted metal-dependent phosphoesterase TrpH
MIVDFHSHTTASDGSLAPGELAAKMRARGVRVFSVTDHDTTAAYADLIVDFARVVPGIEINTSWRDEEVHVLGYDIPLDDASPVGLTIAENRAHRRARLERMVANVVAAGYPITLGAVRTEADAAESVGRPHIAKALIRAGLVPNVETAFRELLGRGKPGYEPSNYITPQRAIEVIHASGGIAVLAHPGRLHDLAIIDELVASGLDGIEVFYPTHDAQARAHFRALAEQHRLVMTAGSDFHDPRSHERGVGVDVDEGDITPFLERLGVSLDHHPT